ncbi:MAG: RNA polymerase sigma factor [Clostridia bacterium]|nr:RNA polymerase sigma factor [Clostridia bacterium]
MQMLQDEMRNLRQGKLSALETIYLETKDAVFSLCLSYMRNYLLAEDMMQDTYINVRKYIAHYREDSNPKGWINTIAKNLCLNELKRRKREQPLSEDMQIASNYTLKAKDESGVIQLALTILKQSEAKIVMMHAVGDIPLKEVAELVKKPYATVRWQYRNALDKLKKEMEKRELI